MVGQRSEVSKKERKKVAEKRPYCTQNALYSKLSIVRNSSLSMLHHSAHSRSEHKQPAK